MTMDGMVRDLENRGFTVEKKYNPRSKQYIDNMGRYASYRPEGIARELEDKLNRDDRPRVSYRDYYDKANSHHGSIPSYSLPYIKNVIHNDPATIVFWADGTKTVVKCQPGDIYDPEKGLAMAISKKALGNQGNYCNVFKKWLPEEVSILGDEPLNIVVDTRSQSDMNAAVEAIKQAIKDSFNKYYGRMADA